MVTFFLACAALGGVVLVLQLLSSFVGGDADVDHDLQAGDTHLGEGLDLLSVRSISAGIAFFGVVGAGTRLSGWPLLLGLPAAIAAGGVATWVVAYLMRAMRRLEDDGSERIENALGQTATVYLRIPANGEGAGKIHVPMQGRTVEYQAITPGGALPSGSLVIVRDIVGPDTLEVVPQSDGELTDGLA